MLGPAAAAASSLETSTACSCLNLHAARFSTTRKALGRVSWCNHTNDDW